MKYFIQKTTPKSILYRVNDDKVDIWYQSDHRWSHSLSHIYKDDKIWYSGVTADYSEPWTKEVTEAEMFLELL